MSAPRTKPKTYRRRRIAIGATLTAVVAGVVIFSPHSYEQIFDNNNGQTFISPSGAPSSDPQSSSPNSANESDPISSSTSQQPTPTTPQGSNSPLARDILTKLEIKGRAPKTGYTREEFYKTWPDIDGCSLRQRIIKREFGATAQLADDACTVISGEFDEPYTGKHLAFASKTEFSKGIQIDHVVALSDAWQKGAQNLDKSARYNLATDPLNLLAVDAKTNQGKSDGDAATWLPPNKSFRCQYVARQVSVKYKYHLWLAQAEYDAITKVLASCPAEPAVGV